MREQERNDKWEAVASAKRVFSPELVHTLLSLRLSASGGKPRQRLWQSHGFEIASSFDKLRIRDDNR